MSMPRHFPLPIAVDEITRDWLTEALRVKAPQATVRDFEIVDVVYATCTKVRLKLDLDEAGKRAGIPQLVILKGGFEEQGRKWCQMHEREVRGYRDVYPKVPLPAPTCYFADYDADRKQGIVIMDDLLTQNVTFCSALKPQTFDQMSRRLTALARFHAATWGKTEKWSELVDFFEVMLPFFEFQMVSAKWDSWIKAPPGAAASTRFHGREWMIDAFRKMTKFSHGLPQCVLHGDVHLGNLYVYPDSTPGFLDTLASRGPGMLEVSYFISASVDIADRKRWEAALIEHYLRELTACGVEAPSFDEAMRQYGILLIYGYFIWMTTESHYQPPAVNVANVARINAAMVDHDIDRLLASL